MLHISRCAILIAMILTMKLVKGDETYACPSYTNYPLNSSNANAEASYVLYDSTKWESCSSQPWCMVTIVNNGSAWIYMSSACAATCTVSNVKTDSGTKSVLCYSMPSMDQYQFFVTKPDFFTYNGQCITGNSMSFTMLKQPGNGTQACTSNATYCKSDLGIALKTYTGTLNGSCVSSCTPASMYSGSSNDTMYYGTFCYKLVNNTYQNSSTNSSSVYSEASIIASPSFTGLLTTVLLCTMLY